MGIKQNKYIRSKGTSNNMLDNFIFSLGVAAPIFLVMCIGYLLRRYKFIDSNFAQMGNKLVFYVALPVRLFNEVRTIKMENFFDLKFISFIIIGTLLSTALAWFISKYSVKNNSQRGSFIQGSFRGNFLYLGLSLMENIAGTIGEKAPIVIAVVIPLYNILSVVVFSLYQADYESRVSIKDQIIKIIKNPLIIAISLGVVSIALNIKIPIVASRTMGYFENLATPLALLNIGATFDLQNVSEYIKPALIASGLKLIISPTIAVIAALLMGFEKLDIILIYILFGVPTATASFIMASVMGGDEGVASSIIMVTTLLSVITMTLFIFIFKTLGIV